MVRNPDDVLKESEVADWLKMSPSTLRHQRSRKQGIPYLRFGSMVRYRVRDVLEYIDQAKVKVN